MSKKVFKEEDIVLADGTGIKLKPLRIKELREFRTAFNKMLDEMDKDPNKANDPDWELDRMVELTAICIRREHSDLVEQIDELFDRDSLVHTIEVCSGVKFVDPNLMAAAEAALANRED